MLLADSSFKTTDPDEWCANSWLIVSRYFLFQYGGFSGFLGLQLQAWLLRLRSDAHGRPCWSACRPVLSVFLLKLEFAVSLAVKPRNEPKSLLVKSVNLVKDNTNYSSTSNNSILNLHGEPPKQGECILQQKQKLKATRNTCNNWMSLIQIWNVLNKQIDRT